MIRPFKREVKRDDKVVAYVFGWKLQGDEVGGWAEITGPSRSVQVVRADASEKGSCVIEGAHEEGDVACVLHSKFGTELHFANGKSMETIDDLVRLARPRAIEAGDKPFNVTIMVLL